MPSDSPFCDPRLPAAALNFRKSQNLTSLRLLGAINITAWLYRDENGSEKIQINPNTTIAELLAQFGPAATPDAEVGIHSEAKAAEYFRLHRRYQVLQIFSERIPCSKMCAPLLRNYFPNIPWYFYYDRRSWFTGKGGVLRTAGQVLCTVYNL